MQYDFLTFIVADILKRKHNIIFIYRVLLTFKALKALIKISIDGNRRHSIFYYFTEKIRFGIRRESSARQAIYMECQIKSIYCQTSIARTLMARL